jgi:WD40 repeat protein
VIWDIQAEKIIHRLEWKPIRETSSISSLTISPDGTILLSQDTPFFKYRGDCNRLWNLQTGELIREFETSAQWIANEIATTPEGIYLASGIRDNVVTVWNVMTDEIIYSFPSCSPTAMTPDGKVFAYCNDTNSIVLLDLDTGQKICSIQGSTSLIKVICLSSDREWVVSYDADEVIKIYGLPDEY